MLDDFFLRAVLAGVGIAAVAAPLGCFVIWRRLAYFGDTMAHSALLGIAMAVLLDVHVMIGVFAVSLAGAMALIALQRGDVLPADSLLGILSHSTLALGLVLIALIPSLRIDLMGYLFGDILAVSATDIAVIYIGGAAVLFGLVKIWHPLLAASVAPELAAAEGLSPEKTRALFMILVAAVIAIAMKIVGVFLITSLLIIPAAAARRFADGPERMALLAAGAGVVAVIGGLTASLQFDTPSGPSIVVVALVLFLISMVRRGGPAM
ncbi:MAG: metal ABC transporter permease [Rhodospirillaceae bacterium]